MGIILDSIEFREKHKVLDIGCATGTLLTELNNRIGEKCELVGIDKSTKNIEKAKKKSQNLNIKFEEGVIENIQYEDNYFDIVLSTFLFHRLNIESKKKGMKELKRVLKPNGQLFIIDVGKPNNPYSYFIDLFLRFYQEYKSSLHGEVIDILKENEFMIKFIKNKVRLVGTINIILAENAEKTKVKE